MSKSNSLPIGLPRRYQVIGEIGQGMQSRVLEVRDDYLRRRVACKIFKKCIPSDKYIHLIQEARLIAGLQHPGILPIHDLGTLEDGRPYYTMRLVTGETFAQKLERPNFSMRAGLLILIRICQVLSYIHEQDIVHRDLKPANILINPNGEVFLIDWGTSEQLTPEAPVTLQCLEEDEQTALLKGTPLYIAPEILAGEQPSQASDQYAMGVMLYQLLTRTPPFYADKLSTLFFQVRCQDPIRPSERKPGAGISDELDELCMQLLSKNPADRQKTKELAHALRHVIPPPTPMPQTRPPKAPIYNPKARQDAIRVA